MSDHETISIIFVQFNLNIRIHLQDKRCESGSFLLFEISHF